MRNQLCLCFFVCAEAMAIVATAQSPQALYSAGELQAKLADTNAQIHGFHILYDAVALRDADAASQTSVHRELAAYAPSYFFQRSAKRTMLYTAEQDPLQQLLTISGDVALTEHPADRAFVRSRIDGHLPGSASREIMFLALGWWPLTTLKTPQLVPGSAIVLPDVARSLEYRVWPYQSRVGDRWCHVLEHPNHDRLWLDVTHGCMIVAREIVDPRSGNTAQRIEVAKPYEVAAGVWAPRIVYNFLFDAKSGKLTVDSKLSLRQITINGALPATLFRFEPKPGSIELKSGSFEQHTAGGLEFLDETAARLEQFPRYATAAASSGNGLAIVIVVITAFIAFGVVMTLQTMTQGTSVFAKLRSISD